MNNPTTPLHALHAQYDSHRVEVQLRSGLFSDHQHERLRIRIARLRRLSIPAYRSIQRQIKQALEEHYGHELLRLAAHYDTWSERALAHVLEQDGVALLAPVPTLLRVRQLHYAKAQVVELELIEHCTTLTLQLNGRLWNCFRPVLLPRHQGIPRPLLRPRFRLIVPYHLQPECCAQFPCLS